MGKWTIFKLVEIIYIPHLTKICQKSSYTQHNKRSMDQGQSKTRRGKDAYRWDFLQELTSEL